MRPLNDYTLRTVPFRIMTPALQLLSTLVLSALTQVYTTDWPHKQLAAKAFSLRDKTNALKNPTRNTMITHLAAWYGLGHELRAAIATDNPGLADVLMNALNGVSWLQPAWEYIQERMKEWVQQNSEVVQ